MSRNRLLALLLSLGLGLWLRADTKGGNPDPAVSAKRMMTVDCAKSSLFPTSASTRFSLKARALRNSVHALQSKEVDLDSLETTIQSYSNELTTIEQEVMP